MKFLQNMVRTLIVMGSIGGFISGWALIAHAGKPIATNPDPASEPAIVEPLPTLAPLNFSKNAPVTGLQPLPTLPPIPQAQAPRVRLRTRSS